MFYVRTRQYHTAYKHAKTTFNTRRYLKNFYIGGKKMNITLSKEIIETVIYTLKQINVNGYDSMKNLVGTVTMFENLIERANEFAKKNAESAEKDEDGGAQEV